MLTAVVLTALLGLALYGSAWALPAMARGQAILAAPETLEVGRLAVGRDRAAEFQLTNLNSRPVVVQGVRASCTCVAVDALPMEIPPRGRRSLRLNIRPAPEQAGKAYSETLGLYLSIPGRSITLTVRGTVAHEASR